MIKWMKMLNFNLQRNSNAKFIIYLQQMRIKKQKGMTAQHENEGKQLLQPLLYPPSDMSTQYQDSLMPEPIAPAPDPPKTTASPPKKILHLPQKPNGWQSIQSNILMIHWSRKNDLQELVSDHGMIGIIGDVQPKHIQFRSCTQVICIGRRCQLQSLRCLRDYAFDLIVVGSGFSQYSAEELWNFQQNLCVRVDGLDDILAYVRVAEGKIRQMLGKTKMKNFMEKLHLEVNVIYGQLWLTINHHKFHQQSLQYIKQLLLPNISELPHLHNLHSILNVLDLQNIILYRKEHPEEDPLLYIQRVLGSYEGSEVSQSHISSQPDSHDCSIFGISISEEVDDECEYQQIENLILRKVRSRSADILAEEYEQELRERNELLLEFISS